MERRTHAHKSTEGATHHHQGHPCANTSTSMLHAAPCHTNEKSTTITAPKKVTKRFSRANMLTPARPHT